MNECELKDTLDCVSKFDLASMDLRDQALFISALCEFTEKMRPLVVKYSNKQLNNSTFLFKI